MACEITQGRNEPCYDKVGGLKRVYFINFSSADVVTKDVDGKVTDISPDAGVTPANAYQYDLRTGADLTQNIQKSQENGTTVFEQVLNLTLKGMSQALNDELRILAYGRPRIIVEDNNGTLWLVGEEHGATLTGGTLVTGNAMTDLYGATAAFTGMEKLQASEVLDLNAVTVVAPPVPV